MSFTSNFMQYLFLKFAGNVFNLISAVDLPEAKRRKVEIDTELPLKGLYEYYIP